MLRALVIQERFAISFWDALLIHSAEIAEATIFCSEDLSDGQVYGGVRVVNPFNLGLASPLVDLDKMRATSAFTVLPQTV